MGLDGPRWPSTGACTSRGGSLRGFPWKLVIMEGGLESLGTKFWGLGFLKSPKDLGILHGFVRFLLSFVVWEFGNLSEGLL